jgi:hypothetical protein
MAHAYEAMRDAPAIAGAPEEPKAFILKAPAVTFGTIAVDRVGKAVERPGESEVIRRFAQDRGGAGKQGMLCRAVGGAVSEQVCRPASPRPVTKRCSNDKALFGKGTNGRKGGATLDEREVRGGE